ncbi:MerR family transcriptional regulator [Sphingomonas sp. TZW2008]|uniref:MerR family transcriptional regulator n=1 Tax=Sphingomonas sp. TZW2008 TaxID=1917973 RepID=UPI000A26BACA|nr:MerR family transcriptional regulator [Sphingomonas sp. TZW2008]
MSDTGKAPGAFRTIGEVTAQTGVAAHVLRYWETRFPQLRPVTRAGNRRYYRPEDVALVQRIHRLLDTEGYTVKGVQKLLAGEGRSPAPPKDTPAPMPTPTAAAVPVEALVAIRDRLQHALDA